MYFSIGRKRVWRIRTSMHESGVIANVFNVNSGKKIFVFVNKNKEINTGTFLPPILK